MLKQKDIDVSQLCGVSTDGAAVMVGSKSGVVTRLKQVTPGVLSTHCIAHRLALSCCGGADCIPYLVKYQEILNSIYKYFHNSPKNMASLEAIQSILSVQKSRFKEVFHTRWLSFEESVDALVSNYSSLVSVFLEESSGKSLSMYKPITTYKFLYVSHFLCDVLKQLVILSKMYQREDIDFSEVTPSLSATIDHLEKLRDNKNGLRLVNFVKVVPCEPTVGSDGLCSFEYQGHIIRDSQKQRVEAVGICDKFVTEMVKNLNQRFSSNKDGLVMTALSNIFNPSLTVDEKESDIESVSEFLGEVGFAGYREELSSFCQYVKACQDSGSKSVKTTKEVANLAIRSKETFPAAAEAGERLLVLPVSTADCERGFSKQNLIKTCLRNSMKIKSLCNLFRIAIDGPELKQFNFSKAFRKWSAKKARRILN